MLESGTGKGGGGTLAIFPTMLVQARPFSTNDFHYLHAAVSIEKQ